MLNKHTWFFKRRFLRPTWIFNRFLRQTWSINLEQPIVYLYRTLRIALPLLLYAIGIAFGATLAVVSYI